MSVQADIVQLQQDIHDVMQSMDLLSKINIVLQRKLQLQSLVDFATIYETPRNGCSGIGILIEMPTYKMSTNYSGPGPQTVLLLSVLVIECPPINLGPDGTQTDAETVAETVLGLLHQWLIDGQGEIYPQDMPIQPANDVPSMPMGCIAYRVIMQLQHAPVVIPRMTAPGYSIDGSFNVTLTDPSGLPDVDMLYTVDGSCPASANTSATKYTAPFPTQDGDVVRFASFKDGYLPSMIIATTIGE